MNKWKSRNLIRNEISQAVKRPAKTDFIIFYRAPKVNSILFNDIMKQKSLN